MNSEECSTLSIKIKQTSILIIVKYFSVQYWLCCSVALCLLQVVGTFLMLPGLFTTGQVLWFSCIVTPTISISLMARHVNPDVMKKPQGKIQAVPSWEVSKVQI